MTGEGEVEADEGAELGADRRREMVEEVAGSEARSVRGGEITPGLVGIIEFKKPICDICN